MEPAVVDARAAAPGRREAADDGAEPLNVDGRHRRSQATRRALAEAYLELLEAGTLTPTVEQIAAKAGVSSRAVFRHYRDREGFLTDVADRQIERLGEWAPRRPDAEAKLADRIAGFAGRWAAIHERVTNVRRATLQEEARSAVIAQRLTWAHALLLTEAGRVFAPELEAMGSVRGQHRQAVLASLVSFSTWDHLRRYRGLDADGAEAAIRDALRDLLTEPASS